MQNFQVVGSSTFASTGEPGEQPTLPEDPDDFEVIGTLTTLNSSCTGGTCTFLAGTQFSIPTGDLSPAQIQALVDDGWDDSVAGVLTSDDLSLIEGILGFSSFPESSLATGSTVDITSSIPGDPGSPGEPATKGVVVAIGGNSGAITDSSVSVSGNMDLATAISNHAGLLLEIDAVNIEPANGAEGFATATFEADPGEPTLEAVADHGLTNYQLLLPGGDTEAEASISLGIAVDASDLGTTDALISGSSLNVDGNIQQALAVGNRANTVIDISAVNNGESGEEGGLGATSALLSLQQAGDFEADLTTVEANSWMEAFAPGGMSESSLSISGNVTIASATVNEATHSSNVSATNMATAIDLEGEDPEDANATVDADGASASADHVLVNVQRALFTEATSTATLQAYNTEPFGDLSASEIGVQSSGIEMNDNVAESRATANSASNALNLSADATMSATGALTNAQQSFSDVSATADGNVSFVMVADAVETPDTLVFESGLSFGGNETVAAARGNTADNTINVSVGAGYTSMTDDDASASTEDGDTVSDASYALTNWQSNTGLEVGIAATATTGVDVQLAGGDESTVSGSSVNASGNRAQASAEGNVASNTLELASGADLGASGAIASHQDNSSAIDGTANGSVLVSISGDGSDAIVGTSSLTTNENVVTAGAAGNRVTNTLGASSGAGYSDVSGNNASANHNNPANDEDLLATGTYALASEQVNTGLVTSTADSNIGISVSGPTAGDGSTVLNSSLQASHNVTQAVADGNVGTNTVDLGSGAVMSATGVLASSQDNSAEVNAFATANIGLSADGAVGDGSTVATSSLSVEGNTTYAQARGNAVTNALNVDVGAGYSGLSGAGASASSSADGTNASASYVVLNAQTNSAEIGATVSGGLGVDLTGGGDATLASSSIRVSQNRYDASATGNFAMNSVSLTSVPGGNGSVALASTQRNFGDVTANASDITMAVTVSGAGKTGSSTAMSGNRITASATGNSAVNRVRASNF